MPITKKDTQVLQNLSDS
jgi:Polysaccharide pyruvyl transferase.